MTKPFNLLTIGFRSAVVLLALASSVPCAPGQNVAATNMPTVAVAPSTNPPSSPVIAVPRTGNAGQRHLTINQRVKESQGNCDVIFVGDSITEGWERNGSNVWSHYYGHRKALNLGVGGDWTQHVLWRLDNGNLEGLHPKVAVLMIGTNNSSPSSGQRRHAPPQILEGVVAVVRHLQEKVPGIKIILLGIFPRGENFNIQRGDIMQVNQALQKLDDGKAVLYLDFGYRFIEADGSISRGMMADFLHLTPKGYGIWAESIEDKLSQLLGDKRVTPSE